MMELRQLRYLEAVLELGTFAAAGEHEHVSQPALWQQVRSLEREWGVRLFERSGRRVRPTPAALSIVPQIHSILDAAGQLEADVGSIRTGRAVAARYAAPRYARSAAFIFEVIARYREHHPEAPSPIAVSVGTAEAIEALASGRIDLAGAVPPPEWPYRAEPVYEVWLAVVDGNGPSVLDVADLAGRPRGRRYIWARHRGARQRCASSRIPRTGQRASRPRSLDGRDAVAGLAQR